MTESVPSSNGSVWYLDFTKGEAREITAEEHRRMVAEYMKRTTFKDGVVYIDCKPPEARP